MFGSQELEDQVKTARMAVLEGLGRLCKKTKTDIIQLAPGNVQSQCTANQGNIAACSPKKAG